MDRGRKNQATVGKTENVKSWCLQAIKYFYGKQRRTCSETHLEVLYNVLKRAITCFPSWLTAGYKGRCQWRTKYESQHCVTLSFGFWEAYVYYTDHVLAQSPRCAICRVVGEAKWLAVVDPPQSVETLSVGSVH